MSSVRGEYTSAASPGTLRTGAGESGTHHETDWIDRGCGRRRVNHFEDVRLRGVGPGAHYASKSFRSSSRDRRSAARARRSLSSLNQRVGLGDTLSLSSKTIQVVRRHRKQRHTRLRELTRDEEDEGTSHAGFAGRDGAPVCPVCLRRVPGDQDMVEAHIDACLAHESLRVAQEESERASQEDALEDIDIGGDSVLLGDPANLRGALICLDAILLILTVGTSYGFSRSEPK